MKGNDKKGCIETFSALLPLLLLLLLLLSLFLRRRRCRGHNLLRLPSPRSLPIIGHLHLLSAIPHQSLHRLSLRLGPLFSLRLGSVPCIVACSASAVGELLKTHDATFSNRPHTKAVSILTYGSSNFSFAPYGSFWRFTKQLYMSELFSSRILSKFRQGRCDELRRLLEELHAKSEEGAAVDISAELTRMTNNITTRMVVSQRCSEAEDEAEEASWLVRETTELLGKFNVGDYIWFCRDLDLQGYDKRLKGLHRKFDGLMERILKEREEDRRRRREEKCEEDVKVKDLLDIFMNLSEDKAAEVKLTRENVKALIRDIFTGGTDNTSLTVQWALAELINHPCAMVKARAELDSIVGSSRLVDEADITSLPYLQATVMETLRLHPPTPLIPRESSEDCSVGGFDIAAKTRLFINAWAIGRDPGYWHCPLEFLPERFAAAEGSDVDVRRHHYNMIPFGGGRRGCPASTVALLLVQSALATLIQCFEWKVADGGAVVDMAEAPGLTLRRATPLVCIPVARMHGPIF